MTTGRKAILVVVLAAAAAAGAFAVLSRGFSAADEPSRIETAIARRVRHLATPRSARELKNPLPLASDVIDEGLAHFADHCAVCHANDGGGYTEIGQGLYPKAPDMRQPSTQQLSDGELYYIIRNGIRFTGMPAWGGVDDVEEDRDNWALVHFIRHLPKLTPAELEKMRSLNPRAPEEEEGGETDAERRFLESGQAPASPPAHKH
ncbi:MAG TPA: cytochrome c [Vicinamibacteria bacterium]